MSMPIRVLVADDHPIVRGGLVALLSTLDGIEVVGEASDGAEAVREALITRPDVVVLDLRMPRLDGVEAARRIARDVPGAAVLVLTMFDEDELVADALGAGARGYLLKGAEPEEIERAVRAVAAGSAILAPQVVDHLRRRTAPVTSDPFPDLTPRERDILQLVAAGRANDDIAATLAIASKTVRNHLSAIYVKLGLATRAAVIVRARDEGFGS